VWWEKSDEKIDSASTEEEEKGRVKGTGKNTQGRLKSLTIGGGKFN